MIPFPQQVLLLLGKDLRIEARGRQTIQLVVVLGILIMVVLGLGLGAGRPVDGFGASAILWVAYLFGGVLCFERTMAWERHDDAMAGLLAAPISRSAIYISKLLANVALMFTLAVIVTPVAVALFRFDLSAAFGSFAMIMSLGMIGFAAIGTLFAAAVSSSRLQGGLLAMLVFPLCLPIVIMSTQVMRHAFASQPDPASAGWGSGITMLALADIIYLASSWIVFELVLEP
ncbi:MAG: heme exporter protein CcmB [Phycisphaerae bacterium]|nr:heme exporter protein CcmB [Phycisphaerae bacterium]